MASRAVEKEPDSIRLLLHVINQRGKAYNHVLYFICIFIIVLFNLVFLKCLNQPVYFPLHFPIYGDDSP